MLDYDAHGRASTASTVPGTGNTGHHEKTTYDQYGRTFQVFDASRTSADFTHSGVRHVYNARGYPETLQDAVGTEDAQGRFTPSKVYRTVTTMDARGNVVRERLGNGIARRHRFDGETGRILAIRSGLLVADRPVGRPCVAPSPGACASPRRSSPRRSSAPMAGPCMCARQHGRSRGSGRSSMHSASNPQPTACSR